MRYYAQFKDGKLVPGSMVEDPQELAKRGVPISEMGRILLVQDDEGFVQDWVRACGVCWTSTESYHDLECDRHRTMHGPAQKGHPIDVSIKDLWERGEI